MKPLGRAYSEDELRDAAIAAVPSAGYWVSVPAGRGLSADIRYAGTARVGLLHIAQAEPTATGNVGRAADGRLRVWVGGAAKSCLVTGDVTGLPGATDGDLVYYDSVNGWSVINIGTDGKVLGSDGAIPGWVWPTKLTDSSGNTTIDTSAGVPAVVDVAGDVAGTLSSLIDALTTLGAITHTHDPP